MSRNLEILLASAMALAAMGALGVANAQAAEFHCSVEPCRVTLKPDGVGTTAHHVIVVKDAKENSFSTTCKSVTGEATMLKKTSSELTISNIVGVGCAVNGQPATLTSNGCHYLLKSAGTLTISCPAGKVMEFTGLLLGGLDCVYYIPPQGPLSGVKFHNLGSSEVTLEMKVPMAVTTNGECPAYAPPVTGEITTANSILTSETDTEEAKKENFWWE